MYRNSRFVLFFILTIFLIGCDDVSITEIETEVAVEPEMTENTESVAVFDGKSDYIFDQEQLHTFELTLPEADLARIDADPAAEEYVEGSLTFEGKTMSPVGIRYKGSIGAFVGCVSGRDWANPSGRKTCTKLSMKIKINWNDPEARFYKLKKLQFHSQNNDDSQMRDRLGYWCFREMGVPAPRAVHARLLVNGQYMGLFSLVEQIDGRFTRYNFEDGTGNLYKEIWPLTSNGEAFPEQEYLKALKTNEDESPTAERIRQFAQDIADAKDTEMQATIKKWMEIDQILAYAVVDRTIRNDDGAFHWYCGGNSCSPHNFYWYEEPTTNKMHLIPWDLDHAFENIISDVNPVTPIKDAWGKTSNNCAPFKHGFFGPQQRSAACDKLTAGWASFESEYKELEEAFVAGPLSETRTEEVLEKWAAQIRAATAEAANTHGDAISVTKWEQAMETLKKQLSFARL